MGLQDPFINSMSKCMNANFSFPDITKPGMPNFVLGTFLASFAGINYVLQFIPPTPTVLPNIKPPTIDLFLQAFLGGISLPSSYPSISVGPLTIPGVGSPPYQYDLSGELKLMAVCILLPFQLITKMITDLLNLTVSIPTVSSISALFTEIAVSVGISGDIIAKFGTCLASALANLFSSLI